MFIDLRTLLPTVKKTDAASMLLLKNLQKCQISPEIEIIAFFRCEKEIIKSVVNLKVMC